MRMKKERQSIGNNSSDCSGITQLKGGAQLPKIFQSKEQDISKGKREAH